MRFDLALLVPQSISFILSHLAAKLLLPRAIEIDEFLAIGRQIHQH